MSRAELAEAKWDTRDISPETFPVHGAPAEKLRFLLEYAALAPSSHNTQPWLFRVHDDTVEMYADRTRGLPVVDPEDRELTISCGAALFQLRAAMRHYGYKEEVEIFPDPQRHDLLARIRLGGLRQPTVEEHELFHAIVLRRTNRMPFFKRAVPDALLRELARAAEEQGAWLHPVEREEERNSLAVLISEGDRMQWSDKRFRRELAAWLHPNRSMTNDGIPGYAMGMGDLMSRAGPLVIRTFDLGNGTAARDLELAEESPILAVLGTPGDEPSDWLRAGEALARVLLRAAAEGVSASFLNQPVEVPELRLALGDVLDRTDFPQIVLRLGYGREVGFTPRRPLREMLI